MGFKSLKSFFRRIRLALSKLVPRTMALWPYRFTLFAHQVLARRLLSPAPQIWARNSYVSGSLLPFISDLDLTVWFDQAPTPSELISLNRWFALFSKLLPLVKECNIYVREEALSFFDFANMFEIERDPQLVAKIGHKPSQKAKQEYISFLLRMLDADSDNLINQPEVRLAKWTNHFKLGNQLLQITPPSFTGGFDLACVIEAIAQLIEAEAPEERRKAAEAIHQYIVDKAQFDKVYGAVGDPWKWALFPHRYCYSKELPGRLNAAQTDIFCTQLRWEIWGLLGQVRRPRVISNFGHHIERLELLLSKVSSSMNPAEKASIESGVKRLSSLISLQNQISEINPLKSVLP